MRNDQKQTQNPNQKTTQRNPQTPQQGKQAGGENERNPQQKRTTNKGTDTDRDIEDRDTSQR